MNKATYGRPLFVTLAIVSMLLLIVGTVAAEERQLAGVRLNDHAMDLLDTYGHPDGLVTGPPGSPFPQAGLMAGGGAAGALVGGASMGLGQAMSEPTQEQRLAGLAAARGAGAATGGAMVGAGMAGMPGMMPGGPGMMPGGPGMMPGGPGMMPGGPGAFPGAPPGVPGMPGAAAAGQAQAAGVPNWALPVYIDTRAGEMMWLYQRGPVTLGFLLDLDGYVQAIAVAADKCNYARTAKWQPHKYIKLGDDYVRVLERYGWADETNTYTASGIGAGAAAPSVSFSGTNMTFSRDCVLRYTEDGNNIDFTLHNFRVVRIHIWD